MVKKTLTFITGALTDGGAERVLSILANQCAEMGADVSVIILRNRKRTYQLSDKVKCYQINCENARLKTFSRLVQLRKIIKNENVGTLIPFLPIISLYTLVANIGVGRKMIFSERANPDIPISASNLNTKDRIANILMRRVGLFGCADRMVFQTPDAKEWYSKSIQRKSSIILNPLDVNNLPTRYEGERKKNIVAAGRFAEEKNFPMLLRAFAKFRENYPEYRLILYGEGKLKNEYIELVKILHLEKCVEFPGFVDELHERIKDAGMYVSTSNHEGISNSMIEALGMGIPTIVTDCPVGGARMLVKTDENGILIPMNDDDALVEAMNKIASDKDYTERISIAATNIRIALSAERICQQWLDLIV